MFNLDLATLPLIAGNFVFPLFRIMGMLMVMPMIGSRTVPKKVRLSFAIAITLIIAPTIEVNTPLALDVGTWLEGAKQTAIGIMMGLSLYIMIEVFTVGAQLISSQMGLGFANITDPNNGTSVVVIAQFYNLLVMLLFLATNGHLFMLDILASSFDLMPIGSHDFNENIVWEIILKGSWMFSSALLLSLPAVTALLIVNFAFGIMTKAAPQINIFSIGFPFTMVMGLFITWASMEGFYGFFTKVNDEMISFITMLSTGGI